jgi:hypothetical protein
MAIVRATGSPGARSAGRLFARSKWSAFVGDFETRDLSQWQATETSTPGGSGPGFGTQPQTVTSPVRSGSYSCKYTNTGTQFRCETVASYLSTVMREGDDITHTWSTYLPSGLPTGAWQLIGQWHCNRNNGDSAEPDGALSWDNSSPPVAIYAGATNSGLNPAHWYIVGGSNNPGSIPFWSYDLGVIQFDVWTDFQIRLKYSTTAAQCQITVLVNGVQVVSTVPAQPLLYPTTNTDRYNYFKIGVYRDHAISTDYTLYLDGLRFQRN